MKNQHLGNIIRAFAFIMLAIGAFVFYGWYTERAEKAKVIHAVSVDFDVQMTPPSDPEPEPVLFDAEIAKTNEVYAKIKIMEMGVSVTGDPSLSEQQTFSPPASSVAVTNKEQVQSLIRSTEPKK